jgi:hypothetical protein
MGLLAITQMAVASGGETVKKEAVVYGYVVDAATRRPVSGVTVSAASAKHGISKEVSTDADGFFKFRQLPSGDFSLLFDKKGYRNTRKDAVAVKDGVVTKLTIEFYTEKTGAESIAEFDHPVLRLVDGIW